MYIHYDPDEWETIVDSRPCTVCGGDIKKCNGMCNGFMSITQRRRTREEIATIKADNAARAGAGVSGGGAGFGGGGGGKVFVPDPNYELVPYNVPKRGRQCGKCGMKVEKGINYSYYCASIDCPMGWGHSRFVIAGT